jgi:hypothetical protein
MAWEGHRNEETLSATWPPLNMKQSANISTSLKLA